MALTDLGKLLGMAGSSAAGNTAPNINGWQQAQWQVQPGQMIPTNNPGSIIYAMPGPRYTLSDFDIELMAACISNKHPVVEGQSHCFCTLKRLERGISKD